VRFQAGYSPTGKAGGGGSLSFQKK